MKFWAKLLAVFLIAWLPLVGYPASEASCPEMSAMASHQHLRTSSASNATGVHDGRHGVMNIQHICQVGAGGTICGVPAIPVSYSVNVTRSSPVYWVMTPAFAEDFIPELPAPPPRSL
ncbi:hypothetical protein [Caballeronia glebae]|uniref:hypothetical protein n=1 Tax=Caballeronia glebae TaxID=1777143 RepID=UPI0038BA1CC5